MISDLLPRLASRMFDNIYSQADPVGIYLTFDDGPDPDCTLRLLNLLEEYGGQATFFVTGERVEKHPEVLKSVHSAGNAIGIHGYRHNSFLKMSQPQIAEELELSTQIISDLTGVKPKLFRPPYGRFGFSTLKIAGEFGLKLTLWSISAADFRTASRKTLIKRIVENIKPGDILLLHDHGQNSDTMVAAMPTIMNQMRAKRLEMLPLTDLCLK